MWLLLGGTTNLKRNSHKLAKQRSNEATIKSTMPCNVLFPATEALERFQRRGSTDTSSGSETDIDMDSLFYQILAVDAGSLHTPFPIIEWCDSSSEVVDEGIAEVILSHKRKTAKAHKKSSQLSKKHRMVRSKSQFSGLSCLACESSAMIPRTIHGGTTPALISHQST